MVVMRDAPTEAIGIWQARIGSAVHMHRAGAALRRAAAELGALEVERVAQHPEQRGFAVDIDAALRAVHIDRILHGVGQLRQAAQVGRMLDQGPYGRVRKTQLGDILKLSGRAAPASANQTPFRIFDQLPKPFATTAARPRACSAANLASLFTPGSFSAAIDMWDAPLSCPHVTARGSPAGTCGCAGLRVFKDLARHLATNSGSSADVTSPNSMTLGRSARERAIPVTLRCRRPDTVREPQATATRSTSSAEELQQCCLCSGYALSLCWTPARCGASAKASG